MRKRLRQIILVCVLTVNLLTLFAGDTVFVEGLDLLIEVEDESASLKERTPDYFDYSIEVDNYPPGQQNIALTADMIIDEESVSERQIDSENVVVTADEGFVEYAFEVRTAGKYVLFIRYFPIEGKSSSIERSLTIDGEVPFVEAESIILTRSWKDNAE